MKCDLQPAERGYKCSRCGFVAGSKHALRRCNDDPANMESGGNPNREKRFQWGDWVEKHLTRIGITKEVYLATKAAVGLPPNCNCDKRTAWLNAVGEHVGEHAQAAWAKLWR